MDIPAITVPRLVLPNNYVKKRNKTIEWFRRLDEQLVAYVASGAVRLMPAQACFQHKVENDSGLSLEDKQRIADDCKIMKIPEKENKE